MNKELRIVTGTERLQSAGDTDGNPYDSGQQYDTYNAATPVISQNVKGVDMRVPIYEYTSQRLIEQIEECPEDGAAIDIGCGTGITALQLLKRKNLASLLALDAKEGMLEVARWKFHQKPDAYISMENVPASLQSYWKRFRADSQPYRSHVDFCQGSIEELFNGVSPPVEKSMDIAVANQSMHWTDLPAALKNIRTVLKNGASLYWSTSSHYYDGHYYPVKEYGFHRHPLVRDVFEYMEKRGMILGEYQSVFSPEETDESISEKTSEHGFETKLRSTSLIRMDLSHFINTYLPNTVGDRYLKYRNNKSDITACEIDHVSNLMCEAIMHLLTRNDRLEEYTATTNTYEIIPFFQSRKMA